MIIDFNLVMTSKPLTEVIYILIFMRFYCYNSAFSLNSIIIGRLFVMLIQMFD